MRSFLRAGRRELLRLSLSVVIPALNAAGTLPACLARLDRADELILVDGGSVDDTVRIAEDAGARVLISPKGRGLQLSAGGKAAGGEWLLFLHADTLLGANWRAEAERHMRTQSGEPACFRFRLDDPAWQARWIEQGVALRIRLFGLPYGDQGLLVPTELYERAGGYRSLPLMEDVDLVRRLGRVRVLHAAAVTSADRWRREGWFSRSARNLTCLCLYSLGANPGRIARFYARC